MSEHRTNWLTSARLTGCFVLAMMLVAVHLGSAAPARVPNLFRATNYAGDTVRNELAVTRSRAMNVDLTALERAANGVIDQVRLNLFADASFTAQIERTERRADDAYTLFGTLVDDDHARFIAVYERGAILMNLFSRFGDYQVRPINGALVAVQQIDSQQYPGCGCGPAHEVAGEGGGGVLNAGNGDDGSIVDVMVLWTPQARSAAGGLSNIEAVVQGSIAISNTAYENSEVNPRLRLVYSGEVNYTQSSDMGTDLSRLRDTGDGFMDEIHAIRDQYGADMVALLVSNNQYCGIAYLMTTLGNGFAASAFSVSNYSCAVGNITFPHELGHNMGCAHDRDNSGNALFSYSYGWRWFGQSNNQFRSVMAYAPGSRVPHFSNPDVTYDGVATGVPIGQQGEAANAQSINQAAFTIANWRPTAAPLLFDYPDGRPTLLDPTGGTIITVDITEQLDAELDDASPRLHVDLGNGGGFTEVAMTPLGNNRFEAAFPPAECNTFVGYFLSAETMANETVTDPRNAPSELFSAYVASGETVDFSDNFENDLGWTVVNSGSLTDGAWDRGVPVGGGDRGDPPTDFDGSGQCYLTDNVDGNSDVDGGSTTLISPRLDASGPGDPYIAYARWYSNHTGNAPGQDIFTVEISNDDGQSWTSLEIVGPGGPGTQGGWFHRQLRIADFVTPTDQIRVRFTADDQEPGSVVEAGVDAVEVIRYTCEGTEIVDFDIFLGSLLAGGLNELRDSDDNTLRARSTFGFTVLEPDLIDLHVGAVTSVPSPSTLDVVVESRISQPGGQVKLRLRNFSTKTYQQVDSWMIGMSEIRHETLGLSAANRVRASDGRIEVSVKYVVAAVFSAVGFDAFIDQVEVTAN